MTMDAMENVKRAIEQQRKERQLFAEYGLEFHPGCTNCYPACEQKPGSKEKQAKLYRRNDLTQFARKAFENGESIFYAEPADPNRPYGPLKLCKPQRVYACNVTVTQEQYEKLLQVLMSAKKRQRTTIKMPVASGFLLK